MSNDVSKIEAAIQRARMLHKQAVERREASSTGMRINSGPAPALVAPGKNLITVGMLPHVDIDGEIAATSRVLANQAAATKGHSSYRMLRTRLMQRMRANNWRILGVSAAGEGEGKTLTAMNLAISIAAEVGQEAILLELDLRRPSIHERLGISPHAFTSVTRYLQDESAALEELMFCPGIERLGCILCSSPLEHSSDLLASPRGQQLFSELRRRLPPQTVVVVDLPPLLSTDDALVVAPMIDAMLFVVAEGQTQRDDLVEANHLLEEFNVIGTVLNKSVEKDPKKYY
jgi:protein-tyrosine kinase